MPADGVAGSPAQLMKAKKQRIEKQKIIFWFIPESIAVVTEKYRVLRNCAGAGRP
ncbi:hypothetical protein L21SP2_0654 [Salinispira pacifica]|uniref:Uncharacterized protein n=1 Tax=Salinispira pacifica TaxID=1307761 RepID=V5WE60_9SPIO|nr:hypothetical protein L21SP2_0654 [Salinispira pacifica]